MSSGKSDFEKWYIEQWGLDFQGQTPSIDWHTTENMQEAFEAGRAAKVERISWPSQKEIEKEYNALPQTQGAHFGWSECISWLKSKVKVIEMPEFTDDGCDEWLSEMKRLNPNIHPHSSTFSHMETGYEAGFNKCLELIKQKSGV